MDSSNNRPRRRQVCFLGPMAAAGLVLLTSGCSSGWHKPANPVPGAAQPPPKPAQSPARLGEAELEQRSRAHALFAAGLLKDLQGDADGALASYQDSLRADTTNETLALELAQRLLQKQQSDRALAVLRMAVSNPKATGLAYSWLGVALAQSGDTNAAMDACRQAIRRNPSLMLPYHTVFRLQLQRKQVSEALNTIDDAAAAQKGNMAGLSEVVDLLVGMGKAKAATLDQIRKPLESALARSAQLTTTELLFLQRLAEGYRFLGRLDKATEIYQGMLKDAPPSEPGVVPMVREQLFQLYLRSGDRDKAAEQLKALARSNPTNPQVHYLLGALAAEDRDFAEARSEFERALLLNPDFEPAYYELAAAHIGSADAKTALEVLDRARGKFKPNFILDFYTGVAYAGQKDFRQALKSYTSAELLAKMDSPDRLNHIFYFQYGSAAERAGDFEQAEKLLRKCLELSPEDAEALNYLGYMLADRGERLPEARQMLEKAVKLEPKSGAILDSHAWLLYKMGEHAKALEEQLKAIELTEKPDATLYDHLGDIYGALGRGPEAVEAWQRALKIEPNPDIERKVRSKGPGGGAQGTQGK